MRRVYFDNAATTPIHPKVYEKMLPYLSENFGNPSSIHHFGRKVRVAIEESREVIADFINANASEIYFTSGGTEANNFIINGIAKTEFEESKRSEIITSKAEHHCVLDPFEELNKEGFKTKFLEVDRSTTVKPELVEKEINADTSFLSLIHINNETGSLNPINEIARIASKQKIYFNVDAVQSFGKIHIDVKELGIDALCGSAHKINGPKGVGFAYVKSGTPFSPMILGGSQERNRRGGTENVAGIIGFAEAVQMRREVMDESYAHVLGLKKSFCDGLRSLDSENIFINGGNNSSPYILSITLNSEKYNNDPEAMVMFLDINGIAVSNGSACSSGTLKASHVILVSGYSKEDAAGTIRFSFGYQNSLEEIEFTLDVMKSFLKKFSK